MLLMYFDCRGGASEQGQTRDGERVRVTYTTTTTTTCASGSGGRVPPPPSAGLPSHIILLLL